MVSFIAGSGCWLEMDLHVARLPGGPYGRQMEDKGAARAVRHPEVMHQVNWATSTSP